LATHLATLDEWIAFFPELPVRVFLTRGKLGKNFLNLISL